MAKKRMDSETRREQIAEAALKLAATGLSNITVQGVARLIGVVPSALYRHFRNKESIMDAVVELVGNRLLAKATRVLKEDADALDALYMLATFHAALFREQPGLLRLMFSEQGAGAPMDKKQPLIRMMNAYRNAVATILRRGQQAGQVRADADPDDLVFLYLGAVMPPAFMFHVTGGAFDNVEQLRRNWRFLEDSLRPPARGDRPERAQGAQPAHSGQPRQSVDRTDRAGARGPAAATAQGRAGRGVGPATRTADSKKDGFAHASGKQGVK